MRRTHVLECLVSLMLIVGLLAPLAVTASSSSTVVKLWVGNSTMSIGGVSQPIDAEGTKPVIVESRTLVPIRAIIEAFKGSVGWDATERKVTVTLGKSVLDLWIGKATASLNGTSLPVDAANPRVMPVIMSGRTMLPVRFVSESLGIDVQYEATTKMITLTYTVETTLPPSQGKAIWPNLGYDSRHTGQCPYDTSKNDGMLKWKYETPYAIDATAIASDGTLYAGSEDGNLYALNPAGTLRWKCKTPGFIRVAPTIAFDGTIYVASESGYLYAVNPDGTLRWSFRAGTLDSSPAVASDGTIYVGSNDASLYAVNPDGTLKWKFPAHNSVESSPTVAADGTVYVGSSDRSLYAVNRDGSLKWKYQTGATINCSPSIASDGTIYVGSWDNGVYALNTDGTLRWKYDTGGAIQWDSPAISSDGTIYVGSEDHYLYALNSDGTLRWKFGTDDRIWAGPVVSSNGTIYVGSYDHYLYAIDPDGTLRWKFATDGPIYCSPVISSDGTIYAGSRATKGTKGYVYALGGK